MKIIPFVLIILLFQTLDMRNSFSAEENSEYVTVKIISRPVTKKNELFPKSTKRARHLAIVSDILPHGIWEMGPDEKGMIVTTNTVENLSEWPTHQVTQKCIEFSGEYIYMAELEVNKNALLDNIKLYEDSFAGKEKYSFNSYNENWAVDKAIYANYGTLFNN